MSISMNPSEPASHTVSFWDPSCFNYHHKNVLLPRPPDFSWSSYAHPTMGPRTGMKYSLKADVYPRFALFQRRLVSMVPRFERILDSANLWSLISEGKVKQLEIRDRAKYVTDQVKVIIVGNKIDVLESFEQELQVFTHENITVKKERITWTKALAELKQTTRYHPCFMLYLLENPTVEMIQEHSKQFSTLNSDQVRNIIIYDMSTKKNYPYSELSSLSGRTSLPENERCQSVSQQIQYILEDRAIELLEMILLYTNHFVPKPPVEPNQSLLDECSTEVIDCLKSQHVIDDLDPDKGAPEETDAMEVDLSSPSTSLVEASITSIKLQVGDKDTIFLERFMDFLYKKLKSVLCNHLAKKYGISSSFINEFLSEEYHGFDKKYREACMSVFAPRWSKVKMGKQASTMSYDYVTRQSSIFYACEAYVKEKMVVLKEMGKLAFELRALLKDTDIPLAVNLPSYPRLTESLQDMLLDLPAIYGCGTVYGKLTLHVRSELTPSAMQTVRDVLDQHKYSHSFDVQLIAEAGKQAGRAPAKAEVGNQLQATLTDDEFKKLKEENDKKTPKVETNKEKYGSLGCFVKLSKTSADGSSPGESPLHGITCAHCLTDCLPDVNVRIGNKLRKFGKTVCHIDDGERLDMAFIEVDKQEVGNCETCICVFNRVWNLYEGGAGDDDLAGKVVYKRGFQTGLTTGIITCNDYKMKMIQVLNENRNRNLNDVYNILVDVEPGSAQGAAFSERGDSGSAVYYELNSKTGVNNTIVVVSLVQGSMTNGGVYQCTYTCHMKRSIEVLCSKYGYRLVYPGAEEILYMRQGRGN